LEAEGIDAGVWHCPLVQPAVNMPARLPRENGVQVLTVPSE
jgi:hypothetical protein